MPKVRTEAVVQAFRRACLWGGSGVGVMVGGIEISSGGCVRRYSVHGHVMHEIISVRRLPLGLGLHSNLQLMLADPSLLHLPLKLLLPLKPIARPSQPLQNKMHFLGPPDLKHRRHPLRINLPFAVRRA